MNDPRDVLAAALVKANGYTPEAARKYVDAFQGSSRPVHESPSAQVRRRLEMSGLNPHEADQLMLAFESRVLADSDHGAYRMLADKVEAMISVYSFGDLWESDAAEVEILIRFLNWLPDIIRHRAARQLDEALEHEPRVLQPGIFRAAEITEPFELRDDEFYGPTWTRKSDQADVPPGALTAEEIEKLRD